MVKAPLGLSRATRKIRAHCFAFLEDSFGKPAQRTIAQLALVVSISCPLPKVFFTKAEEFFVRTRIPPLEESAVDPLSLDICFVLPRTQLGRPCKMVFGRAAEFAGIVAAEMRGTLVADFKSRNGHRRDAALKKRAGFDHPQILLILER